MKARAAATPIGLVALAVGVAAYAYLVDRGTVSDADRAGRRRDVFPSFRVDEVSRVEIEQGRDVFAVERETDGGAGGPGAWVIASARRQRADSVAVDTLLRELELATRLRDVSDPASLGLETPRARGKVRVGALEYRFEVGNDAPRSEGGAYMRVEGEGTFVVGRSLKVQLLRGVDAYRDRTLVSLGANDVARLDVRGPDGRGFALERRGAVFDIAGAGLRASRGAVEQIFGALADARAEGFLDDGVADRLTATGIAVTLAPQDPRQARVAVRVGGACPDQPDGVVLLRTAPSLTSACTAKALVAALGETTESLVDASPLFAHADEIEQMRLETIAGGGPVVELARKASGWHERSPEERELDADESDSANNLALALAGARAVSTRRAAADEGLVARVRVTIVRTGGGASEVVELAAAGPDGATLLRRLDDGAILRFPRSVARRFEPHPVALRARTVWRPPFDAGAVVAVEDGCTPVPERVELRDRTWAMRSPAGFAADPLSVADLAGAITLAKADAWVSEADDGSFGFEGPASCTVSLVLAESGRSNARRASLVFGAEGDGGVYAHTLADPAVFVVPKVVRDLVSRPAVDRSRFHLDPSALAGVTLVRGTARLVLDRAGEHLTRAGSQRDGGADGDDKLEAALAGLYAQAAVHTGPAARDEGMDRPTLEIVAREADAGLRETRVAIGAPGHVGADDVYFARASGIDATFVVPRRAVSAILDAW
jgi:hypothetical protein